MSQQYQSIVPGTPRIISPSPTPSEAPESSRDSYFAPITRSTTAKRRSSTTPNIPEEPASSDSDLEKRARARSRSPKSLLSQRSRRASNKDAKPDLKSPPLPQNGALKAPTPSEPKTNGHLTPTSSAPSSYWRALSRSPSPLGLIPIHRHWRSFIHRHEIPRKALHLSIGFFTLSLYARGIQTSTIHPYLLGALIPIATTDLLRHRNARFNAFYVRCLGALMRESEVNERYNGVIWYLLGAWAALRWFPKDVGVMSVLLLSWCDTAASTVGRVWGRYTPRIRKGKSLAGSAAAAVVGMLTAGVFYGIMVPRFWGFEESFRFKGTLTAGPVLEALGVVTDAGKSWVLDGWAALGVVSVWSGVVASASELVDLWGLDDNLTIPVLSGIGLWGFLKLFG